ncbi:hypothetical protein, partial [Alicyclobacillus sp.]|uniref:hypothetical protein n=1 Tax=Alicyclobacillus sp. TaxID=61169 RepID=UPI0025B9A346
MGAVAFLDDVTAQCLGWPAIWAAWAPVTPYGRARKAAAGPFLPGEETAWEKALSQLRGDLEGVSDETLARVREHLRELPDVSDILAALRHPGYVLTAAAALALKTF